ncbi:MAG: DNA recombination protein RmuC, partial [Rikenellaceae bacterium]|nr:DNA recombination protein RmuC [Rikenellaceae bacterium]
GDWGEMILETILEKSNLIHGIHYKTQLNIKDEAGNNLRPDVVLYLPGEKSIVIDSKVSLTAYVNYVSAESDAERRAAMAAHVASVRQHVKELSSKSYQRLVQSPDFVIMFVPNEPAFLDALKEDSAIWHDAYERKVVVSSPTNLFALLKIVDDLWRREDQNKNRENIVKLGTKLYEQLVAFTSSLEGVGASLQQAQSRYDEAYKRLHTGNDNIARVGERLRRLGLPTTKRLSSRLTAEADIDDDVDIETDNEKQLTDNE